MGFVFVVATLFGGGGQRGCLCLGGVVGRQTGRPLAFSVGSAVGDLLWRYGLGHCHFSVVCARGHCDGRVQPSAAHVVMGVVVFGLRLRSHQCCALFDPIALEPLDAGVINGRVGAAK